MTKPEFLSKFGLLLKQEPGLIQGTESLIDLPGWDSLAEVEFVMFAESELGEVISPATMAACRTVRDLMNLFPSKIQ
jgi:acyl carrier protein